MQRHLESEDRKAKNGEQGGTISKFLHRTVPSMSPALHNHILVTSSIYSIQTGPCQNVNKTIYLFDKDGQVLSDQNDGTNENISPNWIKANESASKRERIQDFIDGQK